MSEGHHVIGVKGTAATVPFVQAPNAMLRDSRLSSDVRMFLAYVASFHEGWRFFFSSVRADLGWGADKLRKVMGEAERCGGLLVRRERRGDGTLGGFYLVVTWQPWASQISQEMLGISPDGYFHHVVKTPTA